MNSEKSEEKYVFKLTECCNHLPPLTKSGEIALNFAKIMQKF